MWQYQIKVYIVKLKIYIGINDIYHCLLYGSVWWKQICAGFLLLFVYICIYYCLRSSNQEGDSMSKVVGLPNNSYKPITNMAWVLTRLCKLQKRVDSSRK